MLMVGANVAWLRSELAAPYDQLRLRMACCPSRRCSGRLTAIVIKQEGEGSAQFAERGVVIGAADDAVGVLVGAGRQRDTRWRRGHVHHRAQPA
jgi:hypothetical protein